MSKLSLEEIVSWSGIPNISVLDVPILSAYYDDIADCISEWTSVARKCEVDTDTIDADSSSETKDKIVQFLTTWKLRKSNNATFKVLATVLWDSDYADDARKLCDLFKRKLLKTVSSLGASGYGSGSVNQGSISKNIHQSEPPQHSRTESHSSSYTSEEELEFAHGDISSKRLPSDSISEPPSQCPRLESASSDNFSEEEVHHLQSKANISKSLCDLESGYNELKFKIRQLLQERNIGFKDFVEKASHHFPAEIGHGIGNVEDYFKKAQDIGGLSMLHYSLLEETLKHIFSNSDDHLLYLLNEYEAKLANFLTTTKIADFLKSKDKEKILFRSRRKKSFDNHEKSSYLTLDTNIKISVEEKSLQYVLELWKSFQKRFRLTPATVVLEDIKTDCIEIVWLVPEVVVAEILSRSVLNAKDYFSAEKIRIMKINGECIYHEDIHAKEDEMKAQFCLAQACETGRSMEVKAMLEAPKVDINFPNVINGKTPLMLAAQEGYIEIVGTLLEHKASPNIKEDTLGWSALFYAARMGHKLVVEKLLENESDILMTDKNGSTVLDIVPKSSAIYQYISDVTKTHLNLLKACECGDLHQVSFLVARKTTNVDTRREDGKTSLMLAAEHGFAKIIQCLLSCEPNVLFSDDHGAIAADLAKDFPDALDCLSVETMMAAAAEGKVGVIQRMLDLKIDPNIKETDIYGYTALLWACERGYLEVVQLLLQNGADPKAESKETCWNGLLLACRYRHYDIVKILLEQNVDVNKQTADGWTALMIIAANGDTEIAELLLDHGADPELEDKNGFIPLIQAAQNGHYEIVKLLVERNPQIEVDKYRTKEPNDWSAVMLATKNGHTRIVKYLVDKGADLHQQAEDGITVLHIAAYKGQKDLVRYFCLNQKLNVDAQEEDGRTPLMYAAKAGNLDVVKSLIQAFAKINIPENDINWTAPFFAMQAKHQSIVDFFLKCNIDLYHRDSKGYNLMQLSLLFNREAYRSMKAISTEEATELEKPTKFVKSEEYSYIQKCFDKWKKKIGGSF